MKKCTKTAALALAMCLPSCLLDATGYGTGSTSSSGSSSSSSSSGGSGGAAGTGGTGGTGGTTASNGGGGSGAQGGSTSSSGGSGGAAGTGGTGGTSGSGGQGGTGGGPTCMDPPEPNALTLACNPGCTKVLVSDGGVTVVAESSADDAACEGLPFSTHPGSGQYALIWVFDPVNNNAFTAQSLGSYPIVCQVKCGPAPNPGPAPDHQQMETQLLNGGYTTVACGANPQVSLSLPCTDGMYAVLQFPP